VSLFWVAVWSSLQRFYLLRLCKKKWVFVVCVLCSDYWMNFACYFFFCFKIVVCVDYTTYCQNCVKKVDAYGDALLCCFKMSITILKKNKLSSCRTRVCKLHSTTKIHSALWETLPIHTHKTYKRWVNYFNSLF
jgi:hypothetical protein